MDIEGQQVERDLREKISELDAALIDSRALYLLLLDRVDCSAWDFDELSPEEQRVYRRQAVESLEMEEPLMMLQIEDLKKTLIQERAWRLKVAWYLSANHNTMISKGDDFSCYEQEAFGQLQKEGIL